MAASPQPLRIWRTVVPPAWIDYNGHLNEGYYGVAFGDASDALLEHLGFDGDYREAHGTFYTVETRIRFLREVHEGSEIHAATLLLGADEKRLHVHHDLLAGDSPDPVATQETMMLHVARGPDGPGVTGREPDLVQENPNTIRYCTIRRYELKSGAAGNP